MRIRTIVAVFIVSVMVASGCANASNSLQVNEIEVAGPGTLGLSADGVNIKAIAVYFHGMDQDEQVTRSDEKHIRLTEALVRDEVSPS